MEEKVSITNNSYSIIDNFQQFDEDDKKSLVSNFSYQTDKANIKRQDSQEKDNKKYKIEDAHILWDKSIQGKIKLPKNIEMKRIITNILNSLGIKKNDAKNQQEEFQWNQENYFSQKDKQQYFMKKSKYFRWYYYLDSEENKDIITHAFWYSIIMFQQKNGIQNQDSASFETNKNLLLDRISKSYVHLLIEIQDKKDKDKFFEHYFDIIAQAVFYCFFYAYPKSRHHFNDELKEDLVQNFSYLFTGVPISNLVLQKQNANEEKKRTDSKIKKTGPKKSKFWQEWNLDLGAGNILNKANTKKEFPQIKQSSYNTKEILMPLRNQRNNMTIKFSPILSRYVNNYKYKTRNYVQDFKMKFTKYDKNQDLNEEKFQGYLIKAQEIKEKSKKLKIENDEQKKKMEQNIRKIKKETQDHHKRLEKRKQEELERGAHEYANYLVSMLNAGLSMANIGVQSQKGNF